MLRAFARFARVLPDSLERVHLQWALSEIDLMHKDLPWIVCRINELEGNAL